MAAIGRGPCAEQRANRERPSASEARDLPISGASEEYPVRPLANIRKNLNITNRAQSYPKRG
eukprot:scaffold2473_cov247-Pinguiococcus_pyrenoidosus.AAC.8